MNLSPEEIIQLFGQKLNSERINNNNQFEHEILEHYYQILNILSHNYEKYREFVPNILSSLEQNDTKSLSYSLVVFLNLYHEVFSIKNITPFDESIFDHEISETAYKEFLNSFEEALKSNDKIRISNFYFESEKLSEEEKKGVISLLLHSIQDFSKTLEWSSEQAETLMLYLPVLRSLLNSLNYPQYFYFICGIYIDRLTTSEYFQHNRNICEELIISSFNDRIPELGFFDSFRCYSNQSSIQTALLYVNISMYITVTSKTTTDKYLKELIWQSMKFFRNVGLHQMAVDVYRSIPSCLKYSDYERRSVDHSYFTCLLHIKNEKLPYEILDYLHSVREDILCSGINDALPWLITLYNIRRLYKTADYSMTALGFYLQIFEKIVPEEKVKKYKEVIEGDSDNLKKYLKESLYKLSETKFKSDIVYDNDIAIKIANRLIESSFVKKDVEAILLASIVKSDFTLIFQTQEVDDLISFKIQINNELEITNNYNDTEKLIDKIEPNYSLIWLLVTEGQVFELLLNYKKIYFYNLVEWDWDVYKRISNSEYFASLAFDDTIKDNHGVRTVFPEEFLNDAFEISKRIAFSKLKISENAPLLIVKDMELVKFPHNLFTNFDGSYININIPITNILSTEWYLLNKDDKFIPSNYTKSIWIPTEAGDLTINKLYSSIEDNLKAHKFEVNTEIMLAKQLSSDLNIVCSHGEKNISNIQVVYPNNNTGVISEKIIGNGKILIFFVCHSGSYNNDFFKNDVNSLVKTYILKGYKSVIAPFWSLHVNIPKIWLPAFLDSIQQGLTIDYSVHKANIAVFKKYPTPAAWACMHLYGNPHLLLH